MGIAKTVIRVSVIGGLALGVAVAVAEPHRVKALAGQARSIVINKIDRVIDDPVALRAQLRELEQEHPERIEAVRGDLIELREQMTQLEQDKAVAHRVVEMASGDLVELKDMLAKAEQARTQSGSAIITIAWNGGRMPLDRAYARATQINQTVNVYSTRVADAQRDLGFLSQQAERLEEMLAKLETERAQFQAQIWQLDGQIEMIARNEKLLDLVEERQAAIDRYDKFEAVSLDQITSRLATIRQEQEAKWQELASRDQVTDYESQAKAMLNAERVEKEVFERTLQETQVQPRRIQISPEGVQETKPSHDTVAALEQIVIQ